jgi:hypothetical protein
MTGSEGYVDLQQKRIADGSQKGTRENGSNDKQSKKKQLVERAKRIRTEGIRDVRTSDPLVLI